MASHTPEIKISPSVLKWARETIGFDVPTAAKKISVKPAVVQSWEENESDISIAKLRKIANAYKRSLALFLLPIAPVAPAFPPDFRTLDSTKTETLSPATRLSVRKAQRNREFYVELLETLDQKRQEINLSFSLDDNPVELANQFRRRIGISVETQFAWDDKNTALRNWVAALENFGVLVFQMSLPLEELRAFCLRDHTLPPAVVLNTKDDQHGRIFSLFHEVSHLLIKQSDIDVLINRKGEADGHKIVEWFANSFAGSFIVPQESLMENRYAKQYLSTKSDSALQWLRSQYKVSAEVILRRFLDLGAISEKEYREKKASLDREIKDYRERQKKKSKKKGGFRSVSMESFQRAGVLVTSKTFDAMERGKISSSDVARFYEINQKHIPRIRGILDRRSK